MKHLLKDANGVGNYTPYVDYSGSTITFQNTIWNKVKRNLVLWYDIKRQGATNENMANNPILKDLSGNGHDATCYNFAWSGMSGIGGYYFDTLTKWYTASGNDGKLTVDNTKIHITRTTTNSGLIYYLNNNKRVEFNDFIDSYTDSSITIKPFKIKVSGLPEGYDIVIDGLYNKNVEGSPNQKFGNVVIHNGEHIIDIGTANLENVVFSGQCHFPRIFTTANMPQIDCDITIEFLPEYPNALVFDGVNDYCKVDGLPILTDYTVITKRKHINTDVDKPHCFASKSTTFEKGAFIIDEHTAHKKFTTYSFGQVNTITLPEDEIIYITPTSYNGKFISKGNAKDDDILWIGQLRTADIRRFTGALYSFVLFNRTLTEDEIKKWIRQNMDENYLLPNERPKPIIYYDFRNGDNSNLTTITDLSGNERHGTMYNFTGEANSGYSDGCLKFNDIDNYIKIPYSDSAVYKTIILLVRASTPGMIYDGRYDTGLTTGIALFYGNGTSDFLSERLSDNAKLYVNGVTNTSYTNADMKGKKCCVAVSDDVLYSGNLGGPPNIGTVRFASDWFSGMELYAFLGFDKILTEEEIRYVMNKYNLLEGIDEI